MTKIVTAETYVTENESDESLARKELDQNKT
jgi:hypothetical protein